MSQTDQEVQDLLPTLCTQVLRGQFAVLGELMLGAGRGAFLTLSSQAREELEGLWLKIANGLVARCCEQARETSICSAPSFADWFCPHAGETGTARAGTELPASEASLSASDAMSSA